MENAILQHLGINTDTPLDSLTAKWIDRAIQEIETMAHFQYIYRRFDSLLPFLKHPGYLKYLQCDASEKADYLLIATTLGVQIDRYLQRLQLTDMAYATIFDATANVFLEQKADAFETAIPEMTLDYRFCPGYGGTEFTDNRLIANELRADRIGISFLESGLMVPLKSMMGVVRIGTRQRKSCAGCAAFKSCGFRQRNEKCYENRFEKKQLEK